MFQWGKRARAKRRMRKAKLVRSSPARSADGGGEGPVPSPQTLPKYNPGSPVFPGSGEAAQLSLRLSRLEGELRDQADRRTFELELEVKRLQIQAEKEIQIRQMELEAGMGGSASPSGFGHFDVSKNIALVPPFREAEVDSYFSAFERVAGALKWPQEVWPLLLQCKLTGKAQEVVASLSLKDSLNYDVVKAKVLRSYELVPEAYRQRFRNHRKTTNKTYIEFARDKESLFDKWCSASKATTLTEVRELVLLEDFKNHLPDRIVVHLNEQGVASMAQAAVLAEEYAITHKTVFSNPRPVVSSRYARPQPAAGSTKTEGRECFYCHRVGHVVVDCPTLKNKQRSPPRRPKEVVLVQSFSFTARTPLSENSYTPIMSTA